jgi:hypothetical protein
MKKRLWAIGLALTCASAQQVQKETREERYIIQKGPTPADSEPVMAGMIAADGRMGLLNVTGKPFSATETRHTLQMLANGAKIETSDSDQLYRDDQGRTRVEQTIDGKTVTVIMDPVARFVAILDPGAKTVHKNLILAEMVNGSVSLANGQVRVVMGTKERDADDKHGASESLGEKEINGVMASGTRRVRVIPAGAIGNDRDLRLVYESWFSSELQVLVKSVNSDPRAGDTTFQLTNIVRGMQDPALFRIPADYTISDRLGLPGK